MEVVFVICAAFLAGLIDSVVGGGGLILVPALFSAYPQAAAATLFGTNKSASTWGTAVAARQYSRRVQLQWSSLLPAALTALVGAFLGAWTITILDPGFLRKVLPFVLLVLLAYTLARKNLGTIHAPSHDKKRERLIACSMGAVMGWYDGFFGPGTGSFLVFLFVRLLGYDFLHASAASKIMNVATNLSALALFAATGHVWWKLGLMMAVANVVGSICGTRLALKHGTHFVRYVFILVVSGLIMKTAYDAFLK